MSLDHIREQLSDWDKMWFKIRLNSEFPKYFRPIGENVFVPLYDQSIIDQITQTARERLLKIIEEMDHGQH